MNASARTPASLSTALAATALALFGIGAGLVSAPAAESMLGAVPKARAGVGVGVGSATNDTTIELGGALVTLAFLPARAKPHPVRVGGSQRGALPRSR